MKNKLASVLFGLTAMTTMSQAQKYYTVDVANDALYKINVTTGVATFIGNLGTDMDGVDLAWHQGALYAKSYGSSTGNRIWQIVTTGMYAGLGLPGALLNGGGYQGAEAAGLASNGTDLYMTYSNQPPVNFYSTTFGKVNPLTGTLTPVSSIVTDADAMGYFGGKFWTVDVINSSSGYEIYKGATIPNLYVGFDTYDNSLATNPVDIEDYNASQFVAIGQTGKYVIRLNKSNGKRASFVPITGAPANAVFKGLAFEPGCGNSFYINPN